MTIPSSMEMPMIVALHLAPLMIVSLSWREQAWTSLSSSLVVVLLGVAQAPTLVVAAGPPFLDDRSSTCHG